MSPVEMLLEPSGLNATDSPLKAESNRCTLCDQEMRPWLQLPGDWRRPKTSAPFQLFWCDPCAYGSLEPRPNLTDLADHYAVDDYYTHHAPRSEAAKRSFAERMLMRMAWQADYGNLAELSSSDLARFGVPSGSTVCDIGCGNGGLLRRVAAAGYNVLGLDPDADACRAARNGGLNVLQGSAEQLPEDWDDAQFDAITMMHVLEHVLDPQAATANVAKLLRSGGRFFVETPNNACLGLRNAGAAWRWLDAPRHLNFFTPESLQEVCRRAGMEIEAVEFTGYTRQFHSEWIADEQEIHRRLQAIGGDMYAQSLRPRNSAVRAWRLLAQTWRASAPLKYDSVRVIARKP
ncbi:MAG: hypothetical protein C0483_09875 [Pirellula sp.]|nr:hypothetical protein [Pirellula sp.]